jgi:hypothetical protein
MSATRNLLARRIPDRAPRWRRAAILAAALAVLAAAPAGAQVMPGAAGKGFLVDPEVARLPASMRSRYDGLLRQLKAAVIRCDRVGYVLTLRRIRVQAALDMLNKTLPETAPIDDLNQFLRYMNQPSTIDRLFEGCFEPTREQEIEARERRQALDAELAEFEERVRRGRPGSATDDPVSSSPFGDSPISLEPMILFGSRTNRADGSYASTGAQPAGAGTGSESSFNFCGAVQGWVTLVQFDRLAQAVGNALVVLGRTEAGFRFGVCHLGDGNKVVFREIRHPGSDGTVRISERERTEIMAHLFLRQTILININRMFGTTLSNLPGEQFAAAATADGGGQNPGAMPRLGQYWPVALYVGGGPSFVSTVIDLTSNQTGAGGAIETSQQNKLDTAWSFTVGAQTALCRACVSGSPIMLGVEGTWTWLPTRDATVTSRAFGFTETGRVSNRSSTRVMVTLSVPFRL